MDTIDTETQAPEHYNPNQLVTYKSINSDGTTYPTEKVNQIEYALHIAREDRTRMNDLQSTINRIIDNLTDDYWYNPNTEKDEVLRELCEILNHNPVKTISFTAEMHFSGTIEIPLSEYEDFDLDDILGEAYVDINNGNVSVDNYELYDAREE